ncbi:MAG: 23S rRNA (pseudouridine(1915)-N(3))-methyltransferase RlmH [Firmicutes bacterium]|nr:23S rRNA (pseudouridine(1915)-N(3))-methyltransferase RlmH [Bacillota bacterium]
MKKITIIAVGKIKESFFKEAIAEYSKRLSRFCKLNIIETEEFAQEIEKESEAVLSAALKADTQIDFVLDKDGEMVSSETLNQKIQKLYQGGDTVCFVIGGSKGLSQKIKQSAKQKISFGLVTYPHQLFRVVLLEQIYRAFTIDSGLPYHK